MSEVKQQKIWQESRDITSLTLHARHSIFASPKEYEIVILAADMSCRGLQHSIEITPRGEIIAGQKRWLAAKRLGWTKIRCRVRFDLAARGEDAILEHMLGDNVYRRQLSDLERARAYQALHNSRTRRQRGTGELRDELGRLFGKSGRTMSRLVSILKTHREVQDAFDRKELTLVETNRIAGLSSEAQQTIVDAIAAGKSAKSALASVTGDAPSRPREPRAPSDAIESLQQLLQSIGRFMQASQKADACLTLGQLSVLRKAIDQLQGISEAKAP